MPTLLVGVALIAAMTRSGIYLSRRAALSSSAVAAAALPSWPAHAAPAGDATYSALLARFDDPSPKQQSADFADAFAAGFNRQDNLIFPSWLEGAWEITSRPVANAAPLGRRFLPTDIARMRLGDLRDIGAPPLVYTCRFVRRASDGAVVPARADNLAAVQNAAAGFSRVQSVDFDGAGKISVVYSPFGRNGTYPGPARSEVYLNWRKESSPAGAV